MGTMIGMIGIDNGNAPCGVDSDTQLQTSYEKPESKSMGVSVKVWASRFASPPFRAPFLFMRNRCNSGRGILVRRGFGTMAAPPPLNR